MSRREIWIIEAVGKARGKAVALPLPGESEVTRRGARARALFLAKYGFIPLKYQVTCYVPRATPAKGRKK